VFVVERECEAAGRGGGRRALATASSSTDSAQPNRGLFAGWGARSTRRNGRVALAEPRPRAVLRHVRPRFGVPTARAPPEASFRQPAPDVNETETRARSVPAGDDHWPKLLP
jgi:hypothetical protein